MQRKRKKEPYLTLEQICFHRVDLSGWGMAAWRHCSHTRWSPDLWGKEGWARLRSVAGWVWMYPKQGLEVQREPRH